MYEVNLDTSDAVSFEEGVEVSIGNWDKNGKWIPLVYHSTNSNGIVSHMIRGHIVPVHMKSGIFNVTVCGQSIKNGFQIRWLQDIRIFNASDAMSKIATLDAIRANLYINQTKISLLPENDCFYNLRCVIVIH